MADPATMMIITVALNAATMAMTMMNKVEGPRLSDLSVSVADYGTPLVSIYGTKRVECPCIYAEEIREQKKQTKGKGGKYVEYSYYGTWASFLADHEITALLRLWLDRHVVFDRTQQTGPIGAPFWAQLSGSPVKLVAGSNFRIYLGTEDQEPDPRLVATIEAAEGAGRCPAYLGVAYAVFEDIPLEKFGNRLPQASAQIMRATPPDVFPKETKANNGLDMNLLFFSRDFRKIVAAGHLWDLANRTRIASYDTAIDSSANLGITDDGSHYGFSGIGSTLWLENQFGGATAITSDIAAPGGGCAYVNRTVWCYTFGFIQSRIMYLGTNPATGLPAVLKTDVDPPFIVTHYFLDDDGLTIAIGNPGVADQLGFNSTPAAGSGSVIAAVGSGIAKGMDTGEGTYLIGRASGHLFLLDKDTLAVTAQVLTTGDGPDMAIAFENAVAHPSSIWIENKEYDTGTLELIRTIDVVGDYGLASIGRMVYDPVNHALIVQGGSSDDINFHWCYLDREQAAGYVLGDICADVARLAGMEDSEFDFSALTQNVEGYAWTQGPAKEVVGALLEIHDSDVRQHGFELQGLKRGQPLTGPAIDSDWMVPNGDQPLYTVRAVAETELPRRVFATFADTTIEEQPNTATAFRNQSAVMSRSERSFDLSTLASSPDNMQPLIDRALRREWIGATRVEAALSPLEITLEPGDVRNLKLDEDGRLRCRAVWTKIRANRIIDTRWVLDGETMLVDPDWASDDAISLHGTYTAPGGYTNGRPDETVPIPQETKGFILDTPLLTDADDQTSPFFYIAAGPEFPGYWPGGTVWSSDTGGDGTFVVGFDTFASDSAADHGVTITLLPDALTEVMDEASELEVVMPLGDTLSSVTLDELLNSQAVNLAIVGDELIQFRDATLISTNTYRLTGLIRGVRGTEHETAGHVSGERFILVTSKVRKREMGASEIGDTDYYKFSTTGALEFAQTHTVEFEANAHRPYAPAHVLVERDDASLDFTITWQRRTRIGGSTLNGQDVPLGETSALYRVKIMDGTAVVRTIEVTEEIAIYSLAQQVEDWASVLPILTVKVVQVSPVLNLEGFETEAQG